MAFPKKLLGNVGGIKNYAGSKDKSAGEIATPAMSKVAKPLSLRAPRVAKIAHPGEVDLPAMHTSKHN